MKKYVFNDQMQFLNKTYDSRETTDSLENTVDDEDKLVEDEEVRIILEGMTEDTTYHNQKSQGTTERLANKKR